MVELRVFEPMAIAGGEISSWIAAWGFARPFKAALGGGLSSKSK
jgi:hypothetical protein